MFVLYLMKNFQSDFTNFFIKNNFAWFPLRKPFIRGICQVKIIWYFMELGVNLLHKNAKTKWFMTFCNFYDSCTWEFKKER